MSVPNQKKIKIKKEKCNKEHLYATVNIEAMHKAMIDLDSGAFMLWMYFSKNQDGYQFELSYKDCQSWGIKKDAYYGAVKKLIGKHYLTPIRYESNIYIFSEIPSDAVPQDDTFSEMQNAVSDVQKDHSQMQKEVSEITERNNTQIIQDNKKKIQGKGISAYNYLYDEVSADGYINKLDRWISNCYYDYCTKTIEEKIECWMHLGYLRDESEFIIKNIMEV